MKKYMVYLEDRENVYKIAVPADSEQEAIDFCRGNGDLVAVKDVTEEYQISEDKITKALLNAGFGRIETDFVIRALYKIHLTTD